jgi:methylmalonyl-CoA mutase C-terminal domain/subunit
MTMNPPIKVLLAKIGLDGHDRGFRLVGNALCDANMEVTLGGPWSTVEEVVEMTIGARIEVIAISSLSFDHLLVPKMMDQIHAKKIDPLVVVGGILPDEDIPMLLNSGVARVFHPGTSLPSVVEYIEDEVAKRRKAYVSAA